MMFMVSHEFCRFVPAEEINRLRRELEAVTQERDAYQKMVESAGIFMYGTLVKWCIDLESFIDQYGLCE